MLEIYNEHIFDLFQDPKYRSKEGLKIREQKDQGIFVEGLSVFPVQTYDEIAQYIEYGTALRTIGATNMNATSSWAHTVTTITLT